MSDLSSALSYLFIFAIPALLLWAFRDKIERTLRGHPEVVIQEKTIQYRRFPYLLSTETTQLPPMPNMGYLEVTLFNKGSAPTKQCELKINLRKVGETTIRYSSRVLSSDSTKGVNPITVSIDAHGSIGFHPLCFDPLTVQAFLPNYSLQVPGVFSGTLIMEGEYEMFGEVSYDGETAKETFLAKIRIPDYFLQDSAAGIPNDIVAFVSNQYRGGFAVYLDHQKEGKIRARFLGQNTDEDTKRVILQLNKEIPYLDNIIDDKGKHRPWTHNPADGKVELGECESSTLTGPD